MALANRLAMRQGQSMVLTPQLLQAIKLLQMPNAELAAFIEAELERNPLLERADELPIFDPPATGGETEPEAAAATPEPGDWAAETLESDPDALARNLGTEIDNAFEPDRPPTPAEPARIDEGLGLSATSWTGTGGRGFDEEAPDLEAYVAAPTSFSEFLTRQAMIVLADPVDRMIATALIDALDEAGYLAAPLEDDRRAARRAARARRSGADATARPRADRRLRPQPRRVPGAAAHRARPLRSGDAGADRQPAGAGAARFRRAEARLRRRRRRHRRHDRRDPPARPQARPRLRRARSSRRRSPTSSSPPRRTIPGGSNSTARRCRACWSTRPTPPRSSAAPAREEDRQFLSSSLQTANWLTKSLEQRARTILNVASEIVRRQDGFFVGGVAALRPLNLKTVADAIGVHESTVSRATSNKFIQTPRGLFEMKYFFTTPIASVANGAEQAHSAESVRFKIKQMIDAEDPADVLSDDVIVARLRQADIVVARRTVAKYRDSLRIPSSVERRRAKMDGFRPSTHALGPLSL